jgi:hypothetical protein
LVDSRRRTTGGFFLAVHHVKPVRWRRNSVRVADYVNIAMRHLWSRDDRCARLGFPANFNKRDIGMRVLMPMTAMLIVGCATQPASPPTALGNTPAEITADIQAQRLAAARNLNLKVVNKDGQQLFCRASMQTATHIQRDVECFTGDQVERLQQQTQRDLDQLNNRPNNIKGLSSP